MSSATRASRPMAKRVIAPMATIQGRMSDGEILEQGEHASHQIDAGRDHRGRVHQSRHRGRPGHGIRQPDVKRELGALAHRSEEEERPTDDGDSSQGLGVVEGSRAHLEEVERADGQAEDDRPEDQPDVGDLVDHERLVAGVHVGHVLPVEADEEVRGQAHALPPDDQLDEVGGAHQDAASSRQRGRKRRRTNRP